MDSPDIDVAVVGGGPAGLMAAEVAVGAGLRVVVFDAMGSAGRKFLLAGRGGLNLTHGEPFERLLTRYGEAAAPLEPALRALSPDALRGWSEGLGEPTFVGSSGRVFPKSFKASPLLRAWLRRLAAQGVELRPRHRLVDLDVSAGPALVFATPDGPARIAARAFVLALGGASWPRLGSDGGWVDLLAARGVATSPLRPANCGFRVAWSTHLASRFHAAPLKGVALSFGDLRVRGEALVLADGIEGQAVYALAAPLREAIAARGHATLLVDLKPDVGEAALSERLSRPRAGQSTATFLRKAAGLTPLAIALLREAGPTPTQADALAARIKAAPVRLEAPRAIERAISTAGGIRFDALDAGFMIRALPGIFAAGEMLDWEAPTGGYLLQASFATGAAAAHGAQAWLACGRSC